MLSGYNFPNACKTPQDFIKKYGLNVILKSEVQTKLGSQFLRYWLTLSRSHKMQFAIRLNLPLPNLSFLQNQNNATMKNCRLCYFKLLWAGLRIMKWVQQSLL